MLGVEGAVGCGATLGVGAGPACAPVAGVAVVAVPGCGLIPEPVLGALPEALPDAVWLAEPGAADCAGTCPFVDWPPGASCGEAAAPVDPVDLPGSGVIGGWTWPEPVVAEPPRSAAGAWVPGVAELIVEPVVEWLLLGSVDDPFQDLPAASPGPVLCCAGCSVLAPREVKPAAWEGLDPPRSACGANPVLTVDDRSTVVVSGWEAGWDAAVEFTGVVATGWLVTALVVLAAAMFAGAVAGFTGWFNADANDGERPGEPLLGRLERPEEKAAAEYGVGAPG